MSGTSALQGANVRSMSAANALDHLESVGQSRGDKRLRENSRTFTKANKRTEFNLALNQYKQKICGNNPELKALWESKSTVGGKHDMTGNELKSLVAAMKDHINGAQSKDVPQSGGSLGNRNSISGSSQQSPIQTNMEDVHFYFQTESQEPKLNENDKSYLQTIVSKHDQDQQNAPAPQPYARNKSDSFDQQLNGYVGGEDQAMSNLIQEMDKE